MKEGDKEEGMEGMGDALHHHHHHEGMHHEEMVHHHHHLHAMHHVAVSEADGSVHMVEVIQTEPGHLDVRPLPLLLPSATLFLLLLLFRSSSDSLTSDVRDELP
jgi:hypothetical protein